MSTDDRPTPIAPAESSNSTAHEWECAQNTCVLFEPASLPRWSAMGTDLKGLLQRLGTGDVDQLTASRGCPTVLTSPKGRILQALILNDVGDERLALFGGTPVATTDDPAGELPLTLPAHLKKYTFAERFELSAATHTRFFALRGPRSAAALQTFAQTQVSGEVPALPEPFGSVTLDTDSTQWTLLGHDGCSSEGFGVLVPADRADAARTAITAAVAQSGGVVASPDVVRAHQVAHAVPRHGAELTEAFHPLELDLRSYISFTKGCYVGQEVVARMENYDKISRILRPVTLEGSELGGTAAQPLFTDRARASERKLACAGRDAGVLTSAARLPDGSYVGLAVLKKKQDEPGRSFSLPHLPGILVTRIS